MQEFGAAFWEASRAIRAYRGRALQAHGLHAGQNVMLEQLWREDGLTPGELAELIGIETPTVTRMAQRMERAGFVRRVPDMADRRLVRVRLTEAGQRLRAVIPAAMARADEQALAGFTPAERGRFVDFLRRTARNLEGAGGWVSASGPRRRTRRGG
jgi:DNA-binding MarR family transcriptional regulator